jgi:hypothetical protein
LKCGKFTDDGPQVIAIVHMDLWSRWTKKVSYFVYTSNELINEKYCERTDINQTCWWSKIKKATCNHVLCIQMIVNELDLKKNR